MDPAVNHQLILFSVVLHMAQLGKITAIEGQHQFLIAPLLPSLGCVKQEILQFRLLIAEQFIQVPGGVKPVEQKAKQHKQGQQTIIQPGCVCGLFHNHQVKDGQRNGSGQKQQNNPQMICQKEPDMLPDPLSIHGPSPQSGSRPPGLI